ncbi:hypothetical protein ACFOZ1_10975 [Gracilibacillus marinus]|uniref:Methyl-accepting chemotaxis protein n=1 Tax=Gracilibacillus marinus TaxID=630535 RepID=A0ABV8VXA6_9BACI
MHKFGSFLFNRDSFFTQLIKKSIRSKLMVLFLLLSLIPAVITSWILIAKTASGLNTAVLTNQEQANTIIMNQIPDSVNLPAIS